MLPSYAQSDIPARASRRAAAAWRFRRAGAAAALVWLVSSPVLAQTSGQPFPPLPDGSPIAAEGPDTSRNATPLDALISRAVAANPRLHAAQARVAAAQARIAPAGARPDPMLMAGIQNFPTTEPGFTDFMTMKMVGVSQTIPYPGKLGLARGAAEREVEIQWAELDAVRLDVVRDVKAAYYELAHVERALEILDRNRVSLVDMIGATGASYSVGRGGQQDVLRARVEAARLGEAASALVEQRLAALARLNAALDRPSESPVAAPAFPAAIVRAAVSDTATQVRFVAPTLGARAADSPLPSLTELQAMAVRQSPALRAYTARIGAQAARVELAGRAHLPDLDVSLSYGQRSGFSDMLSAVVSVPIPLQRAAKQTELLAAAGAELRALEAERHAMTNELRAEVARRVADIERGRTHLALYTRAVLPQAQAAVESSLAGFEVGRADLMAVLEAQATRFGYELAYYRALADFATAVAELERTVGAEILP